MLFTPPGSVGLVRIHAPWTTEEEIEQVVEHLKAQQEVEYDNRFLISADEQALARVTGDSSGAENIGNVDEMFEEAKQVVISDRKCSISYIQRKLRIGYNRSATIVEQLEKAGILSSPNHKGIREILV
jgi:S-DNA-T family DNA segregation ATPase FtsK/SpoIIIE